MSRQINNKEKSKPIFITSIVLGVLAAFVLLLSIVQKDASFLVSLIGLVGLILLMNIAQRLNINKEKIKMWSIICIILLIIAIPLLIKYVIFSLMLSIPTFILTKKLIKISNLLLVKIAYFGSLLIALLGIAMSVVGFIMGLVKYSL